MDRNTLIGFVLITALVIGYFYMNAPSQAEMDKQKHVQDSIALVNSNAAKADSLKALQPAGAQTTTTTTTTATALPIAKHVLGDTTATAQTFTIENELMQVKLSSQGGKVVSVVLKNYHTYYDEPLTLFSEGNNQFGYTFPVGNNNVNTNDVVFTTEGESFAVAGKDSNSIVFRAYRAPQSYIEQTYTLKGNSYMMGYRLNLVGMDTVIAGNASYLSLNWNSIFNHTEKDLSAERNYASAYLKYTSDDVASISEHYTGTLNAPGNIAWMAFKAHYFSAALIPQIPFDQGNFATYYDPATNYLKQMSADLVLPYKHNKGSEAFPMQFYFGPNNYCDLKSYGVGLEKIIPLGVGLFAYVAAPISKAFIIPMFDWLSKFMSNYGLIILVMTLILRLILFPLTYRSFRSAAKLRVLQPEIHELKEKYKDDQARFGQEQMKLMRQAGVNPLGGCLPMLLQLPILAAMYTFFPQSIELRQQSFLWVKDLSTYDTVANLSFTIPFYGNHVSLFTLVMTVTSILFAWYNNQFTNVNAQMKWMTYVFPIMLLGIFNNLSAALTYYYTLTNLFSFGQTWVMRNFFIDDAAIHAQIQENKKKPKKKSGFQARLEEMQRKQQQRMRERK